MSLSDCEKCWSTPCECGHGYRNWTPENLREQIAMLEKVLMSQEQKPNVMRGIAAYAEPASEMEKRNFSKEWLRKCPPSERPDAVAALVKRFGRETVRAVVGEHEA